jgi:hypothetical protein
MSAPGTTAPPASTTTPEMDAVDEPWANAALRGRRAKSIVAAIRCASSRHDRLSMGERVSLDVEEILRRC